MPPTQLIIGRFCAIVRGARFIMNGANHKLSGISEARIGDGAVVSSRAVVVSDVPPYAVAGGHPARVIEQRRNLSPPRRPRRGGSTGIASGS